jgi:hypothetical protein
MPLKPSTAAINAITRKVAAQPIMDSSVVDAVEGGSARG